MHFSHYSKYQKSFICGIGILECFFVIVHCHPIQNPRSKNTTDPISYLQNFGWMNTQNDSSKIQPTSQEITEALKNFQAFAGIEETGLLDSATIQLMNLPRCGEIDTDENELEIESIDPKSNTLSPHKRRKRFAIQGSRWKSRQLTYNISKYSNDLPHYEIDSIIERAFQQWENVANISFKMAREGKVYIDIRFEVREHGDEEIFDGPGGTTAHAYFPVYTGKIHFDDDETWTQSDSGINLFQVATHEIGHALGLEHSNVPESVMAPFYRTYHKDFKLHIDDIEAIQTVYGKRVLTICDETKIDSATSMVNGFVYIFSGRLVYQLTKEGKVATGYPKSISVEFPGLPSDLDASLTRHNGVSYFFLGDEFWRVTNMTVDIGFPKKISHSFPGIPTPIDAITTVGEHIFFFKGSKYWKFDYRANPSVSAAYPKPISDWNGIPNDLDAATRFKDEYDNNFILFFKGDRFWRFNDKSFTVFLSDPPYPRLISTHLFNCKH